ncbi:MAG: diguanylate cyclase [Legionella sp.]|uniref:diguanylate cyclase domain-containing protein n=1 Tax=Legionella sp. TaxID=459 RepID=UPI0028486DE8|nr:diguanylate cyclase [Legionella sp.]
MLYKIFNYLKHSDSIEKYTRQYRLIQYVTWELLFVCTIVAIFYSMSQLWAIITTIGITGGLALANLWLLKRTKNVHLCSQLLAVIIFFAIVIGNYLVWGIGPLHTQWFYVMPLLAASLTGMSGLLIYSMASMLILIAFNQFVIPPYYNLPHYQFLAIELINHLFTYLIIVTTLASLLRENERYEQELNDRNYLLQTEKDKYHYLARFDHLTNLPNRRYFIQHLHELINTISPNHCITVFFIDLDNFKHVNDRYGHSIGDQLLLETSRRLQLCFREKDFIARLGGDEFTAIVPHAPNKQTPQVIAERIIEEFQPIVILENSEPYCYSISIGSATYPDDAKTATDLVVKADLAMYDAKKVYGCSYSSLDGVQGNQELLRTHS